MDRNKKTFILINPASQSGYSLKIWKKELEPLFVQAGVVFEVRFSRERNGMEALAREITAEKNPVNLIVLGGDGTASDALNGVSDLNFVDFGYIPTGSSNDFARAICQRNPVDAAASILESKVPEFLDLGELSWIDADTGQRQSRLFLESAGMGFDAAACEMADRSRWKKILNRIHLGKLIYLFSAIRLILTSRLKPMDISVTACETHSSDPSADGAADGHGFQSGTGAKEQNLHFEHTLFAACMNHPYEGGAFMFCPEAKGNDGILDFCVAADISRIKFFQMFPTAYTGGHVGKKGVTVGRGEAMSFTSPEPQFIHADGEVLGKVSRIDIRTRRKILRLLNRYDIPTRIS